MDENEKFNKMMLDWGIKPPGDSSSTQSLSSGSEKLRTNLNALLADWCSDRYANPLEAYEALNKGENLIAASASFFWYCYSKLDEFSVETQSILVKLKNKQIGPDQAAKKWQEIEEFGPQLTDISHKFPLKNVKYPSKPPIYVEVFLGAASIILLSQEKKWHKDAQTLIEKVYGYIGQIPIGESGYEMRIGMPPIEIEKTDDSTYILSGTPDFLAMLACVIIWDSYANLLIKQKDYQGFLDIAIKVLEFCWDTLSDAIMTELESKDIVNEVDYDVSFHLPYSGVKSLDVDYFDKICNIWELAKKNIHSVEGWKQASDYLDTLRGILKELYRGPETIEVREIEDNIRREKDICQFAMDNPRATSYIFNANEEIRERTIRKYFFPRGLPNHFEKGTWTLVMNAENAWWKNDFGTIVVSQVN